MFPIILFHLHFHELGTSGPPPQMQPLRYYGGARQALADPLLAARGHHRVHQHLASKHYGIQINNHEAPGAPARFLRSRGREKQTLHLCLCPLSLLIPLSCPPGASILSVRQYEVVQACLPLGSLLLRGFGPARLSRSRGFRPERPRWTNGLGLPRNESGVSTQSLSLHYPVPD